MIPRVKIYRVRTTEGNFLVTAPTKTLARLNLRHDETLRSFAEILSIGCTRKPVDFVGVQREA